MYYTGVISIGYSLDLIIPENNVINLMAIRRRGESRHTGLISCFTTQGHENPVWMISSDDFSSGPLMNNGTVVMELGGVNVTITIDRISLYESEISIDANSTDFTSNLTCQSQNNPSVRYTVIVTTSENILFLYCRLMNIYVYYMYEALCVCVHACMCVYPQCYLQFAREIVCFTLCVDQQPVFGRKASSSGWLFRFRFH